MPHRKWIVLILAVVVLLIALASLDQRTQWDGIDVAVVGRYGTELGREPWTPFINLQGDALLFAFTVAGALGGFAAGYYWRELFEQDNPAISSRREIAGKEASQDV